LEKNQSIKIKLQVTKMIELTDVPVKGLRRRQNLQSNLTKNADVKR
jgi:hypothetical protein